MISTCRCQGDGKAEQNPKKQLTHFGLQQKWEKMMNPKIWSRRPSTNNKTSKKISTVCATHHANLNPNWGLPIISDSNSPEVGRTLDKYLMKPSPFSLEFSPTSKEPPNTKLHNKAFSQFSFFFLLLFLVCLSFSKVFPSLAILSTV
jgi:hypothetical protein